MKGKVPSFRGKTPKDVMETGSQQQVCVPDAFLQSHQDHSSTGGEACVPCMSTSVQLQDKDPITSSTLQ